MTNILLIARRQVGAMREDRHLVFLLGLVAALGIVSALAARHHAASETEQRARYQAVVDRQWAEQPERHPHRVIHYGFLVFREEAPLAFFDPGVGGFAGMSLFLEGHRQNSASFGDARHATAMLSFGRLTPAAGLGLLLPLLIVAAGFASVSGEREKGTLPLILAQGATPAQIMAGKARLPAGSSSNNISNCSPSIAGRTGSWRGWGSSLPTWRRETCRWRRREPGRRQWRRSGRRPRLIATRSSSG